MDNRNPSTKPRKDRPRAAKRPRSIREEWLDFGGDFLRAAVSGGRGDDDRIVLDGMHGFYANLR